MANRRTFSDVRNVILSAHRNTDTQDKVGFYDTWAENYEQDVALLDYRAPLLAAECVSSFYKGDRENITVLDVACGTGLVSAHLKKMGFHHFVGVDGSLGMLELAKKTGLYEQFKQCLLGQDSLPVEAAYEIVIIVGALSVGQVPLTVIREMWEATKPGGYVCMTTRGNADNLEYKVELEKMIKTLEEEDKWRRVTVVEVEEWERAVSQQDDGYLKNHKEGVKTSKGFGEKDSEVCGYKFTISRLHLTFLLAAPRYSSQ
ncbi:methyltransferase-like protein 27 isoform X2 [Triplophysa rosa]|uniref:methyltransferase-like protein 27 isoform X2 n=1 Tax=Triplophysa rosa TaxID=992332 RepID=UPI002545C71B|nr:methyltransferase-like protein 27 isoform X2 [Triplophysa rosa]